MYTKLIFHNCKQVHFPPTRLHLNRELKNVKYQFGVKNTEFKIQNLRYIGLFSQSIVFKAELL